MHQHRPPIFQLRLQRDQFPWTASASAPIAVIKQDNRMASLRKTLGKRELRPGKKHGNMPL